MCVQILKMIKLKQQNREGWRGFWRWMRRWRRDGERQRAKMMAGCGEGMVMEG